jgi:hypothetical protein
MTDLETILPRPGEVRPDKPYRTPDRRWEEVTEEIYGSTELPRNIDHEYDLYWNTRFWSVQNAHDQYQLSSFGFWTVIGLLMLSADLGWLFWRMR